MYEDINTQVTAIYWLSFHCEF